MSAQLLQLLDSVFLRNTLEQRLIKGSEVEHVGVMELIRGLFETDPVAAQHGRYSRRLQQPQLISMVVRMLVGLPSYAHSLTHAHKGHARYVCAMYVCMYVCMYVYIYILVGLRSYARARAHSLSLSLTHTHTSRTQRERRRRADGSPPKRL